MDVRKRRVRSWRDRRGMALALYAAAMSKSPVQIIGTIVVP